MNRIRAATFRALVLTTLLITASSWARGDQEPAPAPDIHEHAPTTNRECFARWDEVLEGWWVLSPSSLPACEPTRVGVTCEPIGAARLVSHEYPDGRFGYRCGDNVDNGAGCLFVPHDPGEPFVCRPRSGISLLCTAWKPEQECARAVRVGAGPNRGQLTKLDFAHCDHLWEVRVWNLYAHNDEPMDCSVSMTGGSDEATCRAVARESKIASSADCMINGGSGNCTYSQGPGDCSIVRNGPLGGPYRF